MIFCNTCGCRAAGELGHDIACACPPGFIDHSAHDEGEACAEANRRSTLMRAGHAEKGSVEQLMTTTRGWSTISDPSHAMRAVIHGIRLALMMSTTPEEFKARISILADAAKIIEKSPTKGR